MPGPELPPVGKQNTLLMKVAEFVGVEELDDFKEGQGSAAAGPMLPEGMLAPSGRRVDSMEQVFKLMDEQQVLQDAWKREEVPVVKQVIERELRALQAKIDAMAKDIEVHRSPDSADKEKDPWNDPPPGKKRLAAGKKKSTPNAVEEFVPAASQAFIDKDPTNPDQVPKLLELQVELEALLEAEKDDESKALLLSELCMLEQRLILAGHTLSTGAVRRAATHEMWRKLDYWMHNGIVQAVLIAAGAGIWYLRDSLGLDAWPQGWVTRVGFNTYVDFFFSDN